MKQFSKLFFAAAVAALGLASCAKEVAPVETPKDNLVTVHFGATAGIEGATKATLTPDEQETLFTSAWENGDVLSVKYSFDYGTPKETTATWSSDKSCFEAQIGGGNGIWIYDALYPTPKEVSFGSERTQNGNNYNSNYDLMKGSATAEGADAGKTADGKDIVFEMTRQTAIAYFHLTSDLDEEVVSAKLSVEGDGAYLSTSEVKANEEYAQGYAFTETEGVASKEINLTFDAGTAPMSSDFKLWFNVLPTKYTKMTLTVETANNTLSISRTAEGKYEAGKLYKVSKSIPREKWVKKGGETPDTKDFVLVTSAQSDWSGSYLLVGANDVNYYAYDESTNKDETWGKCSEVVVKNNTIASTYGTMALEVVPGTTKGTYSILTPSGKYLSASAKGAFKTAETYSANNCDFTISSGENNAIVIKQASSTTRQIRYNHNNGSGGFRWYDGTTANAIYLYKGPHKTALETPANLKVSAAKVVSWDTVSGAASYEVTIGENTFASVTTSYNATAVVDDYYDVSVVAVPSDKENYKNSAAATLTGAKFGTPKLTTPELTEGAIDETSIRVNMTVDDRATNGCTCEIYKGETLVESKTIKVNYVVFSGLESGVTYTFKVNAIAVDDEKPYAASDVASIELKTKPAQHVSDVTAAGTYTIKGLTVYAVANTSVAIAGDNTGYILVYKRSHGLIVGNTFDAAGNAELYNGVWELNSPSITNIKNGETPIYPNAVEATEDYLNAYASSQKIQYVHIKGTQTGKYIEVGGTKVFMETPNKEMEGKVVDAYGFIYGYHPTYKNAYFVVTSIKEDLTIPTLSVDQTSKVWAADATDAFIVNVAVNSEGGDWTVTPETLSWATIAVDKAAGTITVTPIGANETETANEATLTVTHTSDASLTAKISLKQNGKGGAITPVVLYTLTPANGKNSAYDKNCDVTIDGIVWNLTGNSQTNPWRIGGKGITKVDRALYSKTAYPKALTSIKVTFGTSNITVNSCKLVYSTNADFTDSKECNIQFTASSTVEVTDNFPANAYYKLVFNVTNTNNSNKSVQLSKIEFLGLDN